MFTFHIHYFFKFQNFQIQNQWVRFTDKIDKMVEEALRINAKWSLQELSRAINGDGKNTPNPLFR